jgi:effector-binding domain-containing protein/uncharacterized protein YndB with AHSA1/START domain
MHSMTKVLSILLLGLLAVAALAAVIALLLPSSAHSERTVVIDAPPASVFALVSGFGRFHEWSPWHALDPDAEYTFAGPSHGVGAVMTWKSLSPEVGSGSQRIITAEPYRLVRYAYEFGDQGAAEAAITIEPEGTSSRVTWSIDTDFGWNLVGRYFGLAFDRMVGPDFEAGLAKLQVLAEKLPKEDWSALDISIQELDPIVLAVTSGQAGPSHAEVAPALAAAYGEVARFLSRNGLEQAGAPVAITKAWDPEDGWSFFAGIPISAEPASRPDRSAPVRIGQTPEGSSVVAIHVGPYDGIASTHAKVDAFIAAHGLEEAGPRWEQYVSDPTSTPADQLITRVCVPVR